MPRCVVKKLNQKLNGWANYFCLGPVGEAYRNNSLNAVSQPRGALHVAPSPIQTTSRILTAAIRNTQRPLRARCKQAGAPGGGGLPFLERVWTALSPCASCTLPTGRGAKTRSNATRERRKPGNFQGWRLGVARALSASCPVRPSSRNFRDALCRFFGDAS